MHIVVPRIPTLFSQSTKLDSGMIYNIKVLTTFWSSSDLLFYLPCVLPGCLSVRHTHTGPWEARRMVSDPLDLEWQTFESHRVGSRSWTQVLWRVGFALTSERSLQPLFNILGGGAADEIISEMFCHYFSLTVKFHYLRRQKGTHENDLERLGHWWKS